MIFGFWDKIMFTIIAYSMMIYYYIKIHLEILGVIYLIKVVKRRVP